ncbi:MAG: RHS repeat-associated core domain-containing protein [Acidobacteriales bacterium]|nr:RHS repeat-associated core domain-containing protein [Terriglobales bacterium]
MAERDQAGAWTEYVFFGGKRTARRESAGAVYYYFSDHLGSADVVTDAAGVIKEESDYYPYGGERVLTDLLPKQNYKFTSKERDTESGLDYFGARYYSSRMGRWLTPDWANGAEAVPYADFGDPQSLNLYGFVGNKPVTRFDADGHCEDDCNKITVTAEVYTKPTIKVSPPSGGKQTATAEGEVRYTLKYGDKPLANTAVHEEVSNESLVDGQGVPAKTTMQDANTNEQGVIGDNTAISNTTPALPGLAESTLTNKVQTKNTTQVMTVESPSGCTCVVTQEGYHDESSDADLYMLPAAPFGWPFS